MLYLGNGFRSLDDLRDYGQRLLATFPDPDATGVHRIKVPHEAISPVQGDFEREREDDSGTLTGCREAVEILTRNPKKGKQTISHAVWIEDEHCGSVLRRKQGWVKGGSAHFHQIGV